MKQTNKNSTLLWGSGVELQNRGVSIEGLNNAKPNSVGSAIMQLIVILLTSFGATYTFVGMFHILYNPAVLLITLAVSCISFLLLFYLPKKVVGFSLLGLLAVLIAVVFMFLSPIAQGLVCVKDFVLKGIIAAMNLTPRELPNGWKTSLRFNTTLVLVLIVILMTLAVSYFTIRKLNILVLLVTSPFFLIGAAFGVFVPDYWSFALLLGGWTASFAMFVAAIMNWSRKDRVKFKKAKNKPEAAKPKSSLVAGVGVIVAFVTVGAFLLTNYMLDSTKFSRTNNLTDLRVQIKEYSSNIVDLVTGVDHDGSLKEGRLYELGDSIVKKRHYLTVSIPASPDPVYLKGFVGGKYTGNSWENVDDYNAYPTMLKAFSDSKMYPQQFNGELLNVLAKTDKDLAADAKIVTVSNLRRKKDYSYVAYNSLMDSGYKYYLDLTAKAKNRNKYSYTTYLDSTNTFKMNNSDLFVQKNFASLWSQYDAFVKKEYLQLPNGLDNVKSIVKDIKNTAGDNYEIADFVREYLAKQAKYSLMTPQLPAGKDFTENFLFSEKQGYSPHYATAAAVLLRAAGIPTRYVEGYILTDETYTNGTKQRDDNYKINVTDENAHAWVEIYMSNYGWIPIEVTPGFYTGRLTDPTKVVNNNPTDNTGTNTTNNTGKVILDPNADEDIIIAPPVLPKPPKPLTASEQFMATLRKVVPIIISSIIAAVLATLVDLLFFALVLMLKRNMVLAKRRTYLTTGTINKRIGQLYKYFNKLLIFEGLANNEQLPYLAYANSVCMQSPHLEQTETLAAMELFLKSRFSHEPVTEEELAFLMQFVTNYSNALLLSVRGKKKRSFKYIKNLG